MGKKVLVILAEGFEEIEAVTPMDVLRRSGLEVIVAGLASRVVTGAHGIRIEADVLLDQYQGQPDAVVLPGGMPGAKNLGESKKVKELIQDLNRQKKLIGAICASPAVVLTPTGVLSGKKATCYPGFEAQFSKDIYFSLDRVVVDQNITTSRGPGTALEFSLRLVEQLADSEAVRSLKEGMLVKDL